MTKLYNDKMLEALVMEQGFLPFFKNNIRGFSIEELTPSDRWFSKDKDGPWEWKGPVVRNGNCAYGKLFHGKAGFVSMEWFPDLVNYRRSLYPVDAAHQHASLIYNTVIEHESLISKDIKKICGKEGYETGVTYLQMGTWLVIADFEYKYDKNLNPYGWGIARYTTPEALYGRYAIQPETPRTPEESKQRLMDRLNKLLPKATNEQITKIIG